MLILMLHELGHYYTARKHGVAATWPYFIPFPPALGGALNIGTMGAFISMREPIPDRKALFDIGASGPLVGFAVAIPITFLGLYLTALDPSYLPELNPGLSGITLGTPLIYDLLATPFAFAPNQIIHPMAFAGWVGLFVTGINLLPAGQLDGGHVAASYLGERSRWLSFAAVAMLIIFGFGLPAIEGFIPEIPPYTGWLLFALIITFLGIEHPPTLNNLSELDTKRKIAAAFVLVVFILTFTPTPVQG
jgi:membrane-associated protease RseP (regulator of RpoE activity)